MIIRAGGEGGGSIICCSGAIQLAVYVRLYFKREGILCTEKDVPATGAQQAFMFRQLAMHNSVWNQP